MKPHTIHAMHAPQPAQDEALSWELRCMQWATRWLLLLALVLLALAVLCWALSRPMFDLTRMTVVGDARHSSAAEIRAYALPSLKGNFFTQDLRAVQSAIEALPWVRQVGVSRVFPNRLRVQLQEHHAVALWGDVNNERLLNTHGEIFEANDDEALADADEHLPHLRGPQSMAAQVWAVYQSLQTLFEGQALNVIELELGPQGLWRLRLDSGTPIELGRGTPDELQARVAHFLRTAGAGRHGWKDFSVLQSVDLRYPNGYAFRLKAMETS